MNFFDRISYATSTPAERAQMIANQQGEAQLKEWQAAQAAQAKLRAQWIAQQQAQQQGGPMGQPVGMPGHGATPQQPLMVPLGMPGHGASPAEPLMGAPQPQMGGLMGAPQQYDPQTMADAFPDQITGKIALDQRLQGVNLDGTGKALLAVDPTGKLYGSYIEKTAEPTSEQKLIKFYNTLDADDPSKAMVKSIIDTKGGIETDPVKIAETKANTVEKQAQTGLAQAKAKLLQSTGLDDDTLERVYQASKAGQRLQDIVPNLGRGTQGPAQMTEIQNYITKRLKQDNLPPTQIASAQVNMRAQSAAATMAAKRGTNIDIGAYEVETFGDQALEAAEKLGNGRFVPWNQLSNMAEQSISSPELAALKTALQGVAGGYATMLVRGGANNVDAQKKSSELLNGATGIPALRATIAQMKREAAGAREATDKVQGNIAAKITGGSATTAAPAAPNPGITPVQSLVDKYRTKPNGNP